MVGELYRPKGPLCMDECLCTNKSNPFLGLGPNVMEYIANFQLVHKLRKCREIIDGDAGVDHICHHAMKISVMVIPLK